MMKNSLYAQYIKEREGAELVESQHGFISYKIVGEQCRLLDMFVAKEERQKGEFKKLFGRLISVAVNSGAKYMTAQVYLVDPNHRSTLQVALSVGAEIVETHNNTLSLALNLGG